MMDRTKFVLPITTIAMAISFMTWSVLSPLASTFEQIYNLSTTQKSILVAIPVLLGSIMRIPLGIYTDRVGGRKMFTGLLLFTIIPLIGAGISNSFAALLFWAFFIGMAGTSFAISVTFVSKLTPPEKQGTALGINAVGNIGTALAGFVIPSIAVAFGLQWAFWILIFPTVIMAALIWFGTPETAKPTEKKTVLGALSVLKFRNTWMLSLFYFVSFGSFVALGIYLPTMLIDIYGINAVDAGFRAAVFVVAATVFRPVGGYFADKFGAGRVLTYVFIGITVMAFVISFALENIIIMTIACLLIAVFAGLGNGSVFKLVPTLFPKDTGTVTGIVGAWGGLGGFFPPILMGIVKDMTGSYSLGFVLFALLAFVCLFINWLNFDRRKSQVLYKRIA